MSATYTPAVLAPTAPSVDSADLTRVNIRIDDTAPQTASSCRQGCGASALLQSKAVRYLLVAGVVALFIFLFERLLGTSAPQELRTALADSLREAAQASLVGSKASNLASSRQAATNSSAEK